MQKLLEGTGKSFTEHLAARRLERAFTMRSWAEAHVASLEGFIAGFIEGTRLAHDPANRAGSIQMLAERLHVSTALAARTYQALMIQGFGLAVDAAFNKPGFDNVLALRAEIEHEWGGTPPPASRYIDLSYYERALRNVK